MAALGNAARTRILNWTKEWIGSRSEAARKLHDQPQRFVAGFEPGGTAGTAKRRSRLELLAKIAIRYAETVGDSSQVETLAREFAYSVDHVPNLVKQARRAGMLTPTVRGKAGGAATWRAFHYAAGQEPPDLEQLMVAKQGMRPAQAKSVLGQYRLAGDVDLDELGRHLEAIADRTAETDAGVRKRDRPYVQLNEELRSGRITYEEWGRRLEELTKGKEA